MKLCEDGGRRCWPGCWRRSLRRTRWRLRRRIRISRRRKLRPDVVLLSMQGELTRAKTDLAKSDPAPYYLELYGLRSGPDFYRGSLRGAAFGYGRKAAQRGRDDARGLRGPGQYARAKPRERDDVWFPALAGRSGCDGAHSLGIDGPRVQRAAPAYLNVKTNKAVQAEEEDKSPDFSSEAPSVHLGEKLTPTAFDKKAWEDEVRRVSGAFRKYPDVYYATVILQVGASNARMVSSEGSEIETPSATARLVMEAQTRAEDGMDLLRVETFGIRPRRADCPAKPS